MNTQVATAAPPCNRATERIGCHLYNVGTTRDELRKTLQGRAQALYLDTTTAAEERTEQQQSEADHRLANARTLASAALDIVDADREDEPCRVQYIFTESEGPEPVPGQTLIRVPEWNWHVEVIDVLDRTIGRNGLRIAEILEVALHESDSSLVPPPRELSFGFWGTWTNSNNLKKVPPKAGWKAMFELFGEPGVRSTHNEGLRDLLDSLASRHWVDRLSFHKVENVSEFRMVATKLGRPDRWYNGEYGTPVH